MFDQCGIKETEVQAKCGAWDKCAGVVCKADYNEYCLARATIEQRVLNDMWGYRKVDDKGIVSPLLSYPIHKRSGEEIV